VKVRIETVEKLKDVCLKEMGVATNMVSTLQPSQEQVLKDSLSPKKIILPFDVQACPR
jgi:hypothetical protein